MPNRILKESICTSGEIDTLTAEEERFFYRLIVQCDDFGRMDARPPIIRAKCYPLKLDNVKDKEISKWLRSLLHQKLVILYEVDGKQYLQMATWDKHQQKRAQHSKYPAPDDGVIHRITEKTVEKSSDINCNQLQSNVTENREYENTRIENTRIDDTALKLADFVSMKKDEHQKLVATYGAEDTAAMIQILDNYKGANGKKYKSDYRAILNWVVARVAEEKRKGTIKPKQQGAAELPPEKLAEIERLNKELRDKYGEDPFGD